MTCLPVVESYGCIFQSLILYREHAYLKYSQGKVFKKFVSRLLKLLGFFQALYSDMAPETFSVWVSEVTILCGITSFFFTKGRKQLQP